MRLNIYISLLISLLMFPIYGQDKKKLQSKKKLNDVIFSNDQSTQEYMDMLNDAFIKVRASYVDSINESEIIKSGIKGLLIYSTIYLLMNAGIFSLILSIKIKDRYIEYLSDLSGLSKKKPILSLCIAILMFSLAGIPPFAGFFGKFYIFMAALNSGLIYLAVLGVIASVISAFYYLRIIKIMYFDDSQIVYHSLLLIHDHCTN